MKKYIIAITILLSIHNSFAQNTLLKGRILDKETNEVLPYATIQIFNQQTGTTANEYGIFELMVNSQNRNHDTIEFSYLGYDKIKISIDDFIKSADKPVLLKSNPIILKEIVIIPKKYKTTELGIFDKYPQSKQITNLFNNKIGNYFENKRKKEGWIKSVSFYIDKEGHPETPFRVRIYDLNAEKKCPGIDILNKNLIVSAEKPGWFTVDLTNYNIIFPKEGAFIMMEWINSGEKYFYEKEMVKKNENGEDVKEVRKFYGQSIGSVLKQPSMITWGITLGNDWTPYKLYYKGYINAMINAKIIYATD